jgi:predicted AAA+ superfamily ATPase
MERDIFSGFISWKNSAYRKPMLLRGARQTGKTWALKEFGRREYKQLIYCNFEEDPTLEDFFSGSLNPQGIIEKLAIFKNTKIIPEDTLIVFDEIQLSNNALNALKYFCEEAPQYHVAAAGSLLGIRISRPKSFPVGKITILDIYPLSFLEFLTALGEKSLRDLLMTINAIEPISLPFHNRLIDILRAYYIIGGMPEAVARYVQTRSPHEVRQVQNDILSLYTLDFAKHAPKEDITKLSLIWDSIPLHLSRENKKFIFSALSASSRAREYESALQWLHDAGLIYRAFEVSHVEQPIAGFAQRGIFKVYTLDTGLLAAQAKIPVDIFVRGDELFKTYHGAFVENYVAQQLISCRIDENAALYYWKSESRKAEVDFLLQLQGTIFPLEVKAGINPKSKSLATYNDRYKPLSLLRTTLLNLMRNGAYINIPLYAIFCLERVVSGIREEK